MLIDLQIIYKTFSNNQSVLFCCLSSIHINLIEINKQAMSTLQYILIAMIFNKNMQKQVFSVNLALSYVVCFSICKSNIIRM